jgi:hypothetical protein
MMVVCENMICAPCSIMSLLLIGFSAVRFLILCQICDVDWLLQYKVYIGIKCTLNASMYLGSHVGFIN